MFSSYLQSVYSLTSHSFCVPPAYFLFFPLCAPFLIHYSAARDCNKPWDNFSKILSILLSFLMSDTFLCGILNISVHLIQKRDGVLMKSSSGNAIIGEIVVIPHFKRVSVLSHHSFPKSSSNFFAPPQSWRQRKSLTAVKVQMFYCKKTKKKQCGQVLSDWMLLCVLTDDWWSDIILPFWRDVMLLCCLKQHLVFNPLVTFLINSRRIVGWENPFMGKRSEKALRIISE